MNVFMLVIERSTHREIDIIIIIFSDELWTLWNMALSATDIPKFATFKNEHFDFIAKLKSNKIQSPLQPCTYEQVNYVFSF